jgi:hypothetical protein
LKNCFWKKKISKILEQNKIQENSKKEKQKILKKVRNVFKKT